MATQSASFLKRLMAGADQLNPLLGLAEDELQRAPARGLVRLELLIKASAESAAAEAKRLAERYGDNDSRTLARQDQASAMEGLLRLMERGKATVEGSAVAKPMRIRGALLTAAAQMEGAVIEVLESDDSGWVAARTIPDNKGRFDLSFEPAGGIDVNGYVVVAQDKAGAEIARGEPFEFHAGKTLTVKLDARASTARAKD